MNWVLAAVVVVMLAIGGCVVLAGSLAKSTKDTVDFAVSIECYSRGWEDADTGTQGGPPFDGSECERLYADGFADREAGTFDPPRD